MSVLILIILHVLFHLETLYFSFFMCSFIWTLYLSFSMCSFIWRHFTYHSPCALSSGDSLLITFLLIIVLYLNLLLRYLAGNVCAQVQSSAPTVDNYNSKDRSPSIVRNQRKLNLFCKRQSVDTGVPPMRSPTSPVPADIKPKSILKKSNSNVEQPGKPLSPTNSARSNSWVSESMSREN